MYRRMYAKLKFGYKQDLNHKIKGYCDKMLSKYSDEIFIPSLN